VVRVLLRRGGNGGVHGEGALMIKALWLRMRGVWLDGARGGVLGEDGRGLGLAVLGWLGP